MTERLRLARIGQLTFDDFVRFVARASDDELAALMSDPATRKPILDFLYEESVARLRAEQHLDFEGAVVHWHVRGALGGGCDSFQLLVDDGVAWPGRSLTRMPRCSFEIEPVDLLRRVGGQATMMGLIEEGRATIAGDLLFAARVEEIFRRKTFG
jgi:hypothetical protein